MLIGVKHQIKDVQAFWAKAQEEMPKLPADYKLVGSVGSKDGSSAFCLWEAASVDALKGFMEPKWGGSVAVNTYFEADPAKTSGVLAAK